MKRPRAVFRRVSIPFPRRQGWGRVGLIGFGAGVPVANANDAPRPPSVSSTSGPRPLASSASTMSYASDTARSRASASASATCPTDGESSWSSRRRQSLRDRDVTPHTPVHQNHQTAAAPGPSYEWALNLRSGARTGIQTDARRSGRAVLRAVPGLRLACSNPSRRRFTTAGSLVATLLGRVAVAEDARTGI